MDPLPPDRIQRIVSSLAVDEGRAKKLIELLNGVSDPEGDPVRYSVALKAISQAYTATSDFSEHRDAFIENLTAISAGIIG